MTSPVDQKTTKKNVWQMPNSFLFLQNRFGTGQWSFIGPGSEKKWYCISEDSPQGVWDNIAERMLVEFAENGCPIFRATSTCPEVNSIAIGMENCRYTMQPIWKRLRLFFA